MNLLDRFVASITGPAGFARLARDRHSGFDYLAVWLLILVFIAGTRTVLNTRGDFREAAGTLAAGPDFGLRGGEAYFAGDMPYEVVDDGRLRIVVDTTGATGPEVLAQRAEGLLVTRHKLYQKQAYRGVQEVDLRAVPVTVTRDDIVGLVRNLHWFVIAGYGFFYAYSLGAKAVAAVVLALFGLLYGAIAKRQVTFGLGWKLGCYALTVPVALQLVVPYFPYRWWVYWGVALLYLFLGLGAATKPPAAETGTVPPAGPPPPAG